jgi:hypothetical protein
LGLIISHNKEQNLKYKIKGVDGLDMEKEIKLANEYKIFKAHNGGCEKCHGGYKGRMGIFEAIIMNREIAYALTEKENINERMIKDIAIPQGIPTLREDAIIKVLRGETSIEEVSKVVDLYEE